MNETGVEVERFDAAAALAALRERGGERFDPVRFHFIESLAKRTATHDGDARRVLDDRLAAWVSDYAERFEQSRSEVASTAADPETPAGLALLTELVRDLGGSIPDAAKESGTLNELKTLKSSRSAWAKLSVNRRLAPSVAKVPDQAGPLNSHFLALRALELMREISPDYLDRFMSYVDALLWIDRANGGGGVVQKDVVRGEAEPKRKASRKRVG